MSVNRRWILINSCISIVLHLCHLVGSKEIITGPSHIKAFVGQNITFMWNTTNNRTIMSAVFGLSKEGMADPPFINVNMLTRMVHHNAELDKRYAGKVDFVGNLVAGRAWFVMKNLEMNDTNEYLARIAVDFDAVKSHTVKLIVKQPKETVLKKDKYFITAAPFLKTTPKINGTIVKETKGKKFTPSDHDRQYILTVIVFITFASIPGFVVIMLICYVIIIFTKKKKSNQYRSSSKDTYEEYFSETTKKAFISDNNNKENNEVLQNKRHSREALQNEELDTHEPLQNEKRNTLVRGSFLCI